LSDRREGEYQNYNSAYNTSAQPRIPTAGSGGKGK